MSFKEWLALLVPPKDYKQSAGSDIADTIALVVLCAMVLFVVLM